MVLIYVHLLCCLSSRTGYVFNNAREHTIHFCLQLYSKQIICEPCTCLCCVCVSFTCRHREARADLLAEFQLHLQVLQWSPGGERRRGDGGDLQHCHHTQQLPQKQTPGFVEDRPNWLGTRGGGVGWRGIRGGIAEREAKVPDPLCYFLFSFPSIFLSTLPSLSVISRFQPSLALHTYPCCWERQEYRVTVYTSQ